jgi:hypothetical protein
MSDEGPGAAAAGTEASGPVGRVRELERFALERLPSMQLPDGVLCHHIIAGDPEPKGRSLRYTLIALIGLLRAEQHGLEHPLDPSALRSKILSDLGSPALSPGDLGLALWAESRAEGEATEELVAALAGSLRRASRLKALDSMEVAWIVTGLVESGARAELGAGSEILDAATSELLKERRGRSGLVTHAARGLRRRFPHFADQIYSLLALSRLASSRRDDAARDAARALGERLIDVQMPNGAWPWICDPVRGTVVEPYEIYSIHQDSMAMIGLDSLSQATGDPTYRAAAVRGMDWIYGQNELGVRMFDPKAGMIYRSIRRKQRFHRARQARNAAAVYIGAGPRPASPRHLEVNRTMRPYHLGWILEAWCGREHLAAILG